MPARWPWETRLPHRARAPPRRAPAHLTHDRGHEDDRRRTPASACPNTTDRAAATASTAPTSQRAPREGQISTRQPPNRVPTTNQRQLHHRISSKRWIEAKRRRSPRVTESTASTGPRVSERETRICAATGSSRSSPRAPAGPPPERRPLCLAVWWALRRDRRLGAGRRTPPLLWRPRPGAICGEEPVGGRVSTIGGWSL